MPLDLPDAIARYFAAATVSDAEAIAACFTPDAVVIDEGNTYAGRDAIRQWMAHASTQYSFTVEPFAIEIEGPRTVVTCHLAGNFPGSPVDLRYRFAIKEDGIAELEIVP